MSTQGKKGKINTGRWTRAEHEKFMDALEKYGRDWQKIEKKIKTRNLLQIRSHAQKVFLNMTESDIQAYIGNDQDSSFNTNESSYENFGGKKITTKENSFQKKQRAVAKKSARIQEQSEKELDRTESYPEEPKSNTPEKSSDGGSHEVVVSQVLNRKNESTGQPDEKDNTSFFIQLFKENERYFLEGGNFIGLTWNVQPVYYPAFIPVYPEQQLL